jgi:hypothetical protein
MVREPGEEAVVEILAMILPNEALAPVRPKPLAWFDAWGSLHLFDCP